LNWVDARVFAKPGKVFGKSQEVGLQVSQVSTRKSLGQADPWFSQVGRQRGEIRPRIAREILRSQALDGLISGPIITLDFWIARSGSVPLKYGKQGYWAEPFR
jgi:hypothetical protein